MSFTKLVGNEKNKDTLQKSLRNGRIASSYIFAGPEGIGKKQFAITFAKAANCLKISSASVFPLDSCEECVACRHIDAGTFGDLNIISRDAEAATIKIAQTRELSEEAYYRPQDGRRRFIIIDEADRLGPEAANSLLKTLEEPPPTTHIILLTSRPDALLSTIRSRSQRVVFVPLSTNEIEEYLNKNFPRPAADNALLARLTDGCPGAATAYDLSVYRQERKTLIELLDLTSSGSDKFRLLKAAEYLGKKEKDDFEITLNMLSRLLRDIFLIASGRSRDYIVNIDVNGRLESLASQMGLKRIMLISEKFDSLRRSLKVNVNKQLAMEALLLDINQIK